MITNLKHKFIQLVVFPTKKQKLIISILISLMIPAIYLLVYFTGGIRYVYAHTMYIPIVIAGLWFGISWGLIIAFICAIILGPVMPIDVATGEKQDTINWIYRALVFMIVGGLSGYAITELRKSYNSISKLLSKHYLSNVLLYSALDKSIKDQTHKGTIYVFRVLNLQLISDHISINVYYNVWQKIQEQLYKTIPNSTLYQIDNRTFGLITNDIKTENEIKLLKEVLQDSHNINGIPLYLDIVIGVIHTTDTVSTKIEKGVFTARQAEIECVSHLEYTLDLEKIDLSVILISELRNAIIDHQLYLVYQPILDSKTERIVGFETLIRWNHPQYGLLNPNSFIPTLEQTQLIHNMTEFVFQNIKQHVINYVVDSNLYITINISPKNLRSKELIHSLTSDLFTQKQREHIVIEITENIFMSQQFNVNDVLHKIRNTGIRLALDDFGVGYSSLSYLGDYPLDIIKMDKSFLKRYRNPSVKSIIEKTIELSHSLGYKVVAEGLETEYLSKELAALHCDYLQGFYYAKPMQFDKLIDFIIETNKKKLEV